MHNRKSTGLGVRINKETKDQDSGSAVSLTSVGQRSHFPARKSLSCKCKFPHEQNGSD